MIFETATPATNFFGIDASVANVARRRGKEAPVRGFLLGAAVTRLPRSVPGYEVCDKASVNSFVFTESIGSHPTAD